MAVKSTKYKDRPLIGRIKEVHHDKVQLEWFMGSYTSKWKEWTGRSNGETDIYTDSIPRKDIIHTHIQFTLAMRLSPDLAGILKNKYEKFWL